MAIGGLVAAVVMLWMTVDSLQRLLAIERRKIEYIPPPNSDQAILERVLDRLMEVTLPVPKPEAPDEVEELGSPGEYEPPEDDWSGALDWTDPLLGGMERPLVGRLAPGQGIPGIPVQDGQVDPVEMWRERGEAAFDEWARETTMGDGLVDGWQPEAAWVDPVEEV